MTTLAWIIVLICVAIACYFRGSITEHCLSMKKNEPEIKASFSPGIYAPIGKKKYINFCLWSGVEFYIIKYVNKRSESISTLHFQLKECQREIGETGSTMFVFKDVNGNMHTIHAFLHHGQYGEPKYIVRKVKTNKL